MAGPAEFWAGFRWQRNLAHELNGKKINKSKRIKGCKELGGFSSHHGSNWLGVVPELKRESVDGILKRVHFSGERERAKRSEEFKSAYQRVS